MLKGLTVWYLLHKTFKVEPGHRVLIHAAAGGIGLLACQWAKALGANVIGTVGSEEKARLAAANGCDHVILYRTENFVERVKQISRGELCDVVYDGVGKDTFPGSLSCLRPRGLFVSFGNAAVPARRAQQPRLALRDAAEAQRLCRHAQGADRGRRRAVRRRHQRHAARADQPRLCAEGRAKGAPRSGKPRDHGLGDSEAVMRAR
jgi:NADPH:quinone reductase-like Zn-dependent oxidoreductase